MSEIAKPRYDPWQEVSDLCFQLRYLRSIEPMRGEELDELTAARRAHQGWRKDEPTAANRVEQQITTMTTEFLSAPVEITGNLHLIVDKKTVGLIRDRRDQLAAFGSELPSTIALRGEQIDLTATFPDDFFVPHVECEVAGLIYGAPWPDVRLTPITDTQPRPQGLILPPGFQP